MQMLYTKKVYKKNCAKKKKKKFRLLLIILECEQKKMDLLNFLYVIMNKRKQMWCVYICSIDTVIEKVVCEFR